MQGSRFPRWFRMVLVGVFLMLVSVMFLLQRGGVRDALASSLAERLVGQFAPVMEQTMALPRPRPEPPDGVYTINGMLVQYHTLPAPVGPAETLRRFDEGFHKAGYVTRYLMVMGKPTLAAIHPQTKMLLTARPGYDHGKPVVRLSQQDLSELDPKFRVDVPGLPVIPGARNRVLVRSVTGPATTSLTYTVSDTPEGTAAFYDRELGVLGWERLMPPVEPPIGGLKALFFQKGGDECYLVTGPGQRPGEAIVMVTLTDKHGGNS